MKVALIGLMQSGKSTLLGALSGKTPALSGATKIEEAVVPVPDPRLTWLNSLYQPKKTVPATVDCLDMPGCNFTDASAKATSRKMISEARTADLFVLVVRAFDDPSVPAYRGAIDPQRDLSELLSEFLLADLELVLTRIEKLEVQVKKPSKTQERDKLELSLHQKLLPILENEKPVSSATCSEEELDLARQLGFFTLRPFIVVFNIDENQIGHSSELLKLVDTGIPAIALSAKTEYELSQLDDESRCEFMKDLGITEPAANKFVASCYTALGLISFLTVGPDEVRAWPIRLGSTAFIAAGKIHSDIQRGFIRAETIAYDDLVTLGSEKAVKAAGKFRLEGKTYPVQDGDIMNFRFNV